MKIGFTGTQTDITEEQFDQMLNIIEQLNPSEAHHGDCIGADHTFHEMCLAMGVSIIMHPPIDDRKRAYSGNADEVLPAKEFLDRNHDIVDASDALIACPQEDTEKRRSGTWATWRYAKKQNKTIFLILPNGSVQ